MSFPSVGAEYADADDYLSCRQRSVPLAHSLCLDADPFSCEASQVAESRPREELHIFDRSEHGFYRRDWHPKSLKDEGGHCMGYPVITI